MKFSVQPELFEQFPGLCIGVVVIKGCNNYGKHPEIQELLGEVETFVSNNFTAENTGMHENIASWRKAFTRAGKEAATYHTPVEQLVKSILTHASIEQQNKLQDICNYISLKYLMPVSVDDLDKVFGDISLCRAQGTELFIGTGPGNAARVPRQDIIYKDEIEVLSRGWNARKCYYTKATHDTKNAIIYVEGLPPVTYDETASVVRELIELIETFCTGTLGYHILTKDTPEVDIGPLADSIMLNY